MYMLELKNCVRKKQPETGLHFRLQALQMNLIYICFSSEFASAKNIALDAVYGVILTIIATNGVPEAIVAAVLTTAIGKVLIKWRR